MAEEAASAGPQINTRMATGNVRSVMGPGRYAIAKKTAGQRRKANKPVVPSPWRPRGDLANFIGWSHDGTTVSCKVAYRHPIFLRDPDCVTRIACYTAASRLPALVRRSEPQETLMPDKNTPASGFQFSLTTLKPVESSKNALTFPYAAKREFSKNTTDLDIAKGISPLLPMRTAPTSLDAVFSSLPSPTHPNPRT